LNIVKDPDYGGDPALLQAFKEGDKKYTERLELEQRALEAQAVELEREYRRLLWSSWERSVCSSGWWRWPDPGDPPRRRTIYKMTRLMGEVTQGRTRASRQAQAWRRAG